MRRRLPHIVLPLLLLTACGGTVKTGTSIGVEEHTRVMVGDGQVVDQKHGQEVWLATGPVSGTDGINMNGVIVGHVFEDGSSIFTLNVNAYAPPAGKQYVGWLLNAKGEQVELGYLSSPTRDARHQVTLETAQDLRDFTRVQLTLENANSTGRSGPLQGEGTLKVRTR